MALLSGSWTRVTSSTCGERARAEPTDVDREGIGITLDADNLGVVLDLEARVRVVEPIRRQQVDIAGTERPENGDVVVDTRRLGGD